MYLMATHGRVVEIDDPRRIKEAMSKGFREATEDEVAEYRASKADFFNQKAGIEKPESASDVFYQTVRASSDGYGMSRDLLKRELFQRGVLLSEDYTAQKVGLLYSYPYGVTQMPSPIKLIYTMFESDKIPDDWAEYLSQANEVLVPSKWCQAVFKKAGIESTVVPLGYNDKVFGYIDRPVPVQERKDFTFIHYDSFNLRKGFSEVLQAFSREFRHDEPVKLILKTVRHSTPLVLPKSQYPNIEIIKAEVEERELAALLGRSNCMVYPSRGEGFGITPLEAMATGLPAIVPNAHGISEYFDPEYMLEVNSDGRCPGLYNRFRDQDVGDMVVCDIDDLRRQMRYAYNHQAEMKQLGKKASEYVKKYTYAETAKHLEKILDKWQNAPAAARTDTKILAVEKV